MKDCTSEIKRAKRTIELIFGIFAALFIAAVIVGLVYRSQHSFSRSKWKEKPDARTEIVDDLLAEHALVGMQETDILELLGSHDNDYGYFVENDRFVYCLGPERGLFRIDREWLIIDFADGIVVDYAITTD